MKRPILSRWLPTRTRKSQQTAHTQFRLESLESREVPATLTWDGGAGTSFWADANNWSTNTVPQDFDTIVIPASTNTFQNISGLTINRITLNGGNTVFLPQSLELNGSAAGQQIISQGGTNVFVGVGGMPLTGTAPRIEVAAGTKLTISANMTGTITSELQKDGAGTLELTGLNTFAGNTHVRDGFLLLNDASGSNSTVPPTQLIIGDGNGGAGSAFVQIGNISQIPTATDIAINADGVLASLSSDESIGDVAMNGGQIATNNGNFTLGGNLTVHGDASITVGASGGTLTLTSGSHTITVDDTKTLTINASITGTGGVTKEGPGTLKYANGTNAEFNTYSGATQVNDGTLILDKNGSHSGFTGSLTIGDGNGAQNSAVIQHNQSVELPLGGPVAILNDGKLDLNGKFETIGDLTMLGGANLTTGAGNLTLIGGITATGPSILPATIQGNLVLSSGFHNFTIADNVAQSDFVMDGIISGAGGFDKYGPGTMEIKGGLNAGDINTYTGQTNVLDGVLALNHSSFAAVSKNVSVLGINGTATLKLLQFSELPNDAFISVSTGGVLDLNGFSDTIGSLYMDTNSHIVTGAGTLTVFGNVQAYGTGGSPAVIDGNFGLGGQDRTFDVPDSIPAQDLIVNAVISSGGLVKNSGGTLVLNGDNTYSGATTINAGTLVVNGNQPNSDVATLGGTLAGDGSVGNITGGPGMIAPNGTLTAKNVTFAGGTFKAGVNGAGAGQSDQIVANGTVDLTGAVLSLSIGGTHQTGDTFRIIDNDGADPIDDTFANLPQGATISAGGRRFQISYTGGTGNDVVITDIGDATEFFAVGADDGGGTIVRLYKQDGSLLKDLTTYESDFSGGVRAATGDVTGDGVADVIAGTGPGRGAEVRIYDGVTSALVRAIPVFESFSGGVFVTTGDFNHDGRSDIVVTPDQGGGPRVSIFSGLDGSLMANFFGITDPNFRGGARTAVGDMNGDGTPDLYVSAGFGGGPRVTAFDGTTLSSGSPTKLFDDIFVFEQALRNGVYLAAGDLNGDGKADLIAGGGPGGGPRIYALSGADLLAAKGDSSQALANFFAGNINNRGGIRVVAKNLDGDSKADLVVGDGEGAGSQVTSYLGKTIPVAGSPTVEDQFNAYPGFLGGVFVG